MSNCTYIGVQAFWGSSFSSIILSDKLITLPTTNYNPFANCTNLEFVDLGINFNCNNLALFMSTKYSVETLVGVLTSLKDRTGETAYTLYLGNANLAKLTNEQKAIATDKNWVLA